jgi:hypothetical protein
MTVNSSEWKHKQNTMTAIIAQEPPNGQRDGIAAGPRVASAAA